MTMYNPHIAEDLERLRDEYIPQAFDADGRVEDEAIEACRKVGPQEYPNKLITDGYVAAIEATKEVE